MNIKGDPLRFLKRKKTTTPSKYSKNDSHSHTLLPDNFPSLAESKIEMNDSQLQETILLKQNCYNPNKYYSNTCERYLNSINYQQPKQSPTHEEERLKTNESNDSLSDVLFEREKAVLKTQQKSESVRKQRKVRQEQAQELTFKKIQYTQSESSRNQPLQKQNDPEPLAFGENQLTNDNNAQIGSQLRECGVCRRRFNPTSYERHTKICEQVFQKKRKQFSSEKQRSQSKQKK